MKVYVAAHCRWAGSHVATVLAQAGHTIVSTWLTMKFEPTSNYTEESRKEIAVLDADDVARADALVLIAGPDRYPGGKFVEAGIALGLGRRVVVIGRRENMLLWHPSVEQVETPEDAEAVLRR